MCPSRHGAFLGQREPIASEGAAEVRLLATKDEEERGGETNPRSVTRHGTGMPCDKHPARDWRIIACRRRAEGGALSDRPPPATPISGEPATPWVTAPRGDRPDHTTNCARAERRSHGQSNPKSSRHSLARSAGALRGLEERPSALQPLGRIWRMAKGLPASRGRCRQRIRDDRQHHRARPPAQCRRPKKPVKIRPSAAPAVD